MSDYVDFITAAGRPPAVVAHRGAWHREPENSLAAIEAAIAQCYEIVEIDIRRSADGQLFLLHDDTLLRMAGLDRRPEEFTLAELNAIKLRTRDGGDAAVVTDETIPSLEQVFEITRDKIFIDLDVKFLHLLGDVANKAREMGVDRQVDLKADVDSDNALELLRSQPELTNIPFMAKAFFDDSSDTGLIDRIIATGAFMCESKFSNLKTLGNQAKKLNAAGIPVWVNTLDPVSCCELTDSAALANPDTVWGSLIEAGVSVIQTDEPAALRAYIQSREA